MTSKAAMVLAILGMLATVAASTSSAQPEANGPQVHPALCDEQCRAADVVKMMQMGAQTLLRQNFSEAADAKVEEDQASEEQAGREGKDGQEESLDEVEDDNDSEANDENKVEQGDSCTWEKVSERRRGIGTSSKLCGLKCKSDSTCYGYATSLNRPSSVLLETPVPEALIETSSEKLESSRRRRCYWKKGSSCPARCTMPKGKLCGGESSIYSGDSCTPDCARYSTTSFVSPPPRSLSCTDGVLSPAADYPCLPTAVSGKLTAKVIKAEDLDDEDFFSGESDAYVEIGLRHQEKRSTKPIDDTSNPAWNESFDFDISSRTQVLEMHVYDQDDGARDDLLGEAHIDLKEVIETGGPKTYVRDLDGDGKLHVQLSFHA